VGIEHLHDLVEDFRQALRTTSADGLPLTAFPEARMKIIPYTDAAATHFDRDPAKGVAARVVIGKNDGARNFCMRVFEIAPGGYTPRHAHDWEHEMFIHSGTGEIYGHGQWRPVQSGNVAFIPANEEHQIRNGGKDLLIIVCLVPATAPEI
jgi:quercetin dioxygenase-like cupin family protein